MNNKIILLGSLAVIVVASGCVSEVREGEVDQIFDGETTVCDLHTPVMEYDFHTEGLYYEGRGIGSSIYGSGEEITLEGNFSFNSPLEDFNESEAFENLKVQVLMADEDVSVGSITAGADTGQKILCETEADDDGKFACNFSVDEETTDIYITRSYVGCEGKGVRGGNNMRFAEVLESKEYEDDRIRVEFSDIKEVSVEEGWKELETTSEVENKDLGADKAPEGIGVGLRAIDESGERLGGFGAGGDLLEGYSDERTTSTEIRQDQDIEYLLIGYRDENIPLVAFKID